MSNAELVSQWTHGWCLSRGRSCQAAEEGILVVQIGEPGRSVELVVLDADNNPARVQRAGALAFAATGSA